MVGVCGACFISILYFFVTSVACVNLKFSNDNDLTGSIQSGEDVSVVPLHPEEQSPNIHSAIELLELSRKTLEKLNVKLHVIDCSISKHAVCQETDKTEIVRLYQDGQQLWDLPLNSFETQSDAEEQLLRWLKTKFIPAVYSKNDWSDVKKSCTGKKNFVFFHTDKHTSDLYQYFLRASILYEDSILFTYTTDQGMASTLFPAYYDNSKAGVWIGMCAEGTCQASQYKYRLSESNLNKTLQAMLSPLLLMIKNTEPLDKLQLVIQRAIEDHYDVIVLTAGEGKEDKAAMLGRAACEMAIGKAKCVVVHGNSKDTVISDFVTANRIHLSIFAIEGHEEDIEVGYLLAESGEEVYHHWKRLESMRELRRHWRNEDEEEATLAQQYLDLSTRNANDVQDDPVAFAVHNDKYLHDLYLFDHKTINRLTDATFADIVAGQRYAVVLFTLEFNAKSLAVLSTFVHIHQEFKEKDSSSSLHRVECFDWPDVCQKAGFTTFPQMVTYGQGSPVHFSGVWSEERMKKFIRLHAVTWPTLVQSPEKIQRYADIDVIYGLITTQQGKASLREAAVKYAGEYGFVLVHDEATKALAEALNISLGANDDVIVAASDGHYFPRHSRFNSPADITIFVNSTFRNKQIEELTIYNFHQVFNSASPLFIQYKNVAGSSSSSDDYLYDVIERVQKRYEGQAAFMWMDGSPGQPGEYTLHMHSSGKPAHTSMAYLAKNEGKVSFRSFLPDVKDEQVIEWIDSCLSGNSPVSFNKLDLDWSPRLPGHDYLRYMKEEGALPDHKKSFDAIQVDGKVESAAPTFSKPFGQTGDDSISKEIVHTEL